MLDGNIPKTYFLQMEKRLNELERLERKRMKMKRRRLMRRKNAQKVERQRKNTEKEEASSKKEEPEKKKHTLEALEVMEQERGAGDVVDKLQFEEMEVEACGGGAGSSGNNLTHCLVKQKNLLGTVR